MLNYYLLSDARSNWQLYIFDFRTPLFTFKPSFLFVLETYIICWFQINTWQDQLRLWTCYGGWQLLGRNCFSSQIALQSLC